MIYRTLEKIDFPLIHRTFIAAFSDYQVKMDLSLENFERMMSRRGFTAHVSIGAFDGGKLVGFSLTGLRVYSGILTAYDIATGVVPEYRRHGITSEIFFRERTLLKGKHIKQYLLEVIQTNQPAIQLYKKQGFRIQRHFSCFQIVRSHLTQRATYHIEQISHMDPKQAKSFWDFTPSWQNSNASIFAVSEALFCVVARLNGEVAGYGIVERETGDVPQFGVNPKFRRVGVGTSLLVELTKNTKAETIHVLNVETSQEVVQNFLKDLGFKCYIRQYEMLLPI